MKNNNEAAKDQTPKTQPQAPKAKTPKAKREAAPKAEKVAKEAPKAPVSQPAADAAAVKPVQAEKVPKAPKTSKAAKVEDDADTGDRLPGSLDELKATKGGLVSFLFLSGKDKEQIAQELKAAFKLGDGQAAKIVRRITGRVRLFQRAFDLMAAK